MDLALEIKIMPRVMPVPGLYAICKMANKKIYHIVGKKWQYDHERQMICIDRFMNHEQIFIKVQYKNIFNYSKNYAKCFEE